MVVSSVPVAQLNRKRVSEVVDEGDDEEGKEDDEDEDEGRMRMRMRMRRRRRGREMR